MLSDRSDLPLTVSEESKNSVIYNADLLFIILSMLDISDVNRAARVCRFWNEASKSSHLARFQFKKLFPRLPVEGESIDWMGMLRQELLKRCRGFNREQLEDYLAIRTLNISKIKAILATESGHRRLLITDYLGEDIIDFVGDCEDTAKQKILQDILRDIHLIATYRRIDEFLSRTYPADSARRNGADQRYNFARKFHQIVNAESPEITHSEKCGLLTKLLQMEMTMIDSEYSYGMNRMFGFRNRSRVYEMLSLEGFTPLMGLNRHAMTLFNEFIHESSQDDVLCKFRTISVIASMTDEQYKEIVRSLLRVA